MHVHCAKQMVNSSGPGQKTKCPMCRKKIQLGAPAYELNDFVAALAGEAEDVDVAEGAKTLVQEIDELNASINARVRREEKRQAREADEVEQEERRRRRRVYGRRECDTITARPGAEPNLLGNI